MVEKPDYITLFSNYSRKLLPLSNLGTSVNVNAVRYNRNAATNDLYDLILQQDSF